MRKLECLVNTDEVNQIIEDTLPILDKKFGVLEEYTKEMEEILKSIPSNKRSYMYSCVTSIEWFYQLSKLPFDRFKNSFAQGIVDSYCCKFEVCSSELSSFARILCNGSGVPEEAITSL